ncbi:serine/threonine-protein kinase [Nonomuraea sp. SBT364]|uniref:serine/threonine-protein kinase n=1 Tax=Nonomuraea sp. SBT364 TaxID=1580530 RepID=UPI00069E8F53|nr:serine/threonine-protein kinase [Nonomuraea sp. SBT364]
MLGSGTTLNDRYTLTSRLGGGGMGEVWRADDTVLGRTVAVKVLMPALSEDATFLRRFHNEARAMATLRHPGVVDVYDYGTCEIDGRRLSFLVMEFVQGESLDRVLSRGPLSPATAMRLIAEVGDALAAAHRQGIVHRDVKPANLLIRPGGSVALTDFGIAHSASAGQLTATGAMLCSAGYCAPELATASEVTPAVDVYALGVVGFECLTGRLPFEGETPVQIIYKHLHAATPTLPSEVPPGPRHVVAKALEKAPERRWESAEQMAEAARRAFDTPASFAVPRRGRRTMPAVLAVAGAVIVSAAVAGTVWLRPAETNGGQGVIPALTHQASAGVTTGARPSTGMKLAPPSKRSPTARPSQATPTTSTPTATVTVSPTVTPTVTTPPPEPDPEPTDEPTTPGPEEPTSEPTVSEPPGDIQCIRAPCP